MKNTSFGVRKPSVLRGRLFERSTARSTSASVMVVKSWRFGKYCRTSPLVFSFSPRSHDEYGCAK